MYAGDELYDDEVTSGFDDDLPECDTCGKQVALAEELTHTDLGLECGDCSGLSGCVDDICHGMGHCMHGGGR